MGMYPSADLHFGIDISDEHPFQRRLDEFEDDEEKYDERSDWELEDWYVEDSGIYNPWVEVPDEINNGAYGVFEEWQKENPEWRARTDQYYAERRKIWDACPIEIDHYGHMGGYESYRVICLKGYSVHSGFCEEFEMPSLPTAEEIEAARKFCEEHGLPEFKDPKWLLTASYG